LLRRDTRSTAYVPVDVRSLLRIVEVGLGRRIEEAATAQDVDDLHKTPINTHGLQMEGARPQCGAAPDTVWPLHRQRLAAVEHGAGDLQVAQHLAQLLLNVQVASNTDRIRESERQAAEELHLAEHASAGLAGQHHPWDTRVIGDLAAAGAAVNNDPVPGDEHIVEDSDAVHLLEAAAQRVVKAVVWRRRHWLAADELQTRRVILDREPHRVGVVPLGHAPAPPETEQLPRYWRHGAQHLRAAYHNAVARLLHLSQVQERLLLLRRRPRPVNLRVNQHVCEKEVVVADVFVVAYCILPEALAAPRELLPPGVP